MELTRRAWGVTAVGGALAALAVVLSQPLLLGGAAMIGGWILAHQWRFVVDAQAVTDTLAVSQTPDRDQITAGDSVTVTLRAACSDQPPLHIQVQATPPVGTQAPPAVDRTVSLAHETPHDRTMFPLPCPIAGAHTFGDIQITIEDYAGLFRTQRRVGTDATIEVAPRTPRQVHIGEGGEQVATLGDHDTGEVGQGIEAAQVREYVPGDAVRNMDWKATARLNEPYIREHEVTTDRQTVLVVDHRASTGTGPPGERKLDYLREVAIAYLNAARRNDEAIGLIAVGDAGITAHVVPAADEGHYERLARLLYELEPAVDHDTARRRARAAPARRSPAAAQRAAATLAGDTPAFAHTLRPFFESAATYVDAVTGDPLYAAMQRETRTPSGATSTVVLTDDDHRAGLRESLDLAAGSDNSAIAFLTPSVLFETTDDLERAYDTYVDFEDFRRALTARPQVTAYEVAPGDRIEALLAVGRADR